MHLSSKRGCDLHLVGTPSKEIHTLNYPEKIVLSPNDFMGIKPKLLKKEGDIICKGEPIYFDKNDPNVMYTAFCSGKISEIIFGERRIIKKIKISTDSNIEGKLFQAHNLVDIKNIDKSKIMETLVSSGLWPCIRMRPFSKVAKTNKMPKSIFITTQSTAPFSPNLSVLCEFLNTNNLQAGIDVLYALTSSSINMVLPKQFFNEKLMSLQNVSLHTFEGKHPSGNVGYHIGNIDPIKNKDDCVWYVSLQDINAIGTLFLNGFVDEKKIISIGGFSKEEKNKHYIIHRGSLVSDVRVTNDYGEYKIISGDPLSGKIISMDDPISFYDDALSFIDDKFKREFIGWLNPGLNKYSLSRTFLSSLLPEKKQKLTSAMNGSVRTIVPIGAIEKMCVLEIMPTMLLKAILAEDIEMMEELGLYECSPEDFSLCSFVDASKMDIMGIIQKGLDLIEAEG